jgi:hypothetical protein
MRLPPSRRSSQLSAFDRSRNPRVASFERIRNAGDFRNRQAMDLTDLQPRNGKLLKVRAPAVMSNEWLFLPADIELEGSMFEPGFAFADTARKLSSTPILKNLLKEKLDAIWVRARLKFIFAIDSISEANRMEKSLSSFSFVAARQGDEPDRLAIPFDCVDYYGRTSLYFSPFENDTEHKASIADAFWNLIMKGTELADFQDKAYHSMVGFWMHYGCRAGTPFFEEEAEDFDEGDEEDYSL